jgi:hypothetical protein
MFKLMAGILVVLICLGGIMVFLPYVRQEVSKGKNFVVVIFNGILIFCCAWGFPIFMLILLSTMTLK